jgi:hypothetical protein
VVRAKQKNGHLFEEGYGQEELDVVLRYVKVSKETQYIGKRALIHGQKSPCCVAIAKHKVASTGHTFYRECILKRTHSIENTFYREHIL